LEEIDEKEGETLRRNNFTINMVSCCSY